MNLKLVSIILILQILNVSCKQKLTEPSVNGETKLAEPTAGGEVKLTVSKKYLNLPITQSIKRSKMTFEFDGKKELDFVIRLSPEKPDYWVFYDLSDFKGEELKIAYEGNPAGLQKIFQDDQISGKDSLYKETNRPQLHFSSRRGWNNDPNGLVYYEGEYHLFYQHNPFEREWENMTWGHAVSNDLVHWNELRPVLWPDSLGTIFSGSAVIDDKNTSGFGKNGIAPMIAIYTANSEDRQKQCIAYSLDKGRTFVKYEGNPVIDSWERWKTKDLRDPAVFWHEPSKIWVMVLHEKGGMSIYNSSDLKKWEYQSHTYGFWECPQLFELPVDGEKNNKKWVMYGASGTYMIGKFNGKVFVRESGKHYYGNGALYAAQTFTNIPATDGRRIQIAWGRIDHTGMPFKHQMLVPTEFKLRKTKDGIRLFNMPVKEIDALHEKEIVFEGNDPVKASDFLQQFNNGKGLRIKTTIKLSHAISVGINLDGQSILKYDMNYNQVNGMFYSPENPSSMEVTADIIIDRTSVEVFIDGGAFSYALERKPLSDNTEGFKFFGKEIEVLNLKVYPMKSIWENQ